MARASRPILRSERVFLRPAEREDVPTFQAWLADAEVGEGLANRAPWSRLAEEAWYDELQKTQGKTTWHFVICLREGDRPIGFCALHDIDPVNGSAELGIGIGEPAEWDKGYGTEAVEILLDFGFGELRLHRVFLHVFDFNDRAVHVYERAGFRHEGTKRQAYYRHGRYHDMYVMGVLASEWATSERPRSWELD
jgi:RimJ/RimL family protein N-acetyltransferase